MAFGSACLPCLSSPFPARYALLLASLLLGYNLGRSRTLVLSYERMLGPKAAFQVATPLPVAAAAAEPLEIYLQPSAVKVEGLGAVLSGLKPILMLANATGARIAMHDNFTGHGYNMTQYLRFHAPMPPAMRVPCNVSDVRYLLTDIVERCHAYDFSKLRVFERCNSLMVSKYIAHPRTCLRHTQQLVTAFTKFETRAHAPKQDVCVLRRGGDIEHLIRAGEANRHAIDEQLTLPILRRARERARQVVLVTETAFEHELQRLYEPHVLSNGEELQTVVSRLERCRCMFVTASSAFATAMIQITRPTYMVYMSSRPGFSFNGSWYDLDEFGEHAIDVTSDSESIVQRCAPEW